MRETLKKSKEMQMHRIIREVVVLIIYVASLPILAACGLYHHFIPLFYQAPHQEAKRLLVALELETKSASRPQLGSCSSFSLSAEI